MLNLETKIFEVGKHQGKSLQYVYENDEQYLRWMLSKFEYEHSNYAKKVVQVIFDILSVKASLTL